MSGGRRYTVQKQLWTIPNGKRRKVGPCEVERIDKHYVVRLFDEGEWLVTDPEFSTEAAQWIVDLTDEMKGTAA